MPRAIFKSTKLKICTAVIMFFISLGVYAAATNTTTTGITLYPYDYADALQAALNEAVITGKPVILSNPNGKMVYKICKTLIIPDGVTLIGNGATILIDESAAANNPTGFTRLGGDNGAYFPYNQFAIMPQGMIARGAAPTTFTIDSVNFVLHTTTAATTIPKTLFGLRNVKDVAITNSSFSVYSDSRRDHNAFDAYDSWNNLTISGCTFNVLTDAKEGGVWLRNHEGSSTAGGAIIENCEFNKRSGDEMLGIWGDANAVKNITIRNCEFNMEVSAYYNPAHLISISDKTDNITFENNTVHMESVFASTIKTTQNVTDPTGTVYIRNNKFIIDNISSSANAIIVGENTTGRIAYIENNSFKVNTKGTLKKSGIYGKYYIVSGNNFSGNGFSSITANVYSVRNNIVEECENGFLYVQNCTGNTIKSGSGVLVVPATGKPSERITATISGNSFSGTGSNILTFAYGFDIYYSDVMFVNNEFRNGRIYITDSQMTAQFTGNDFYFSSLDDFFVKQQLKLLKNNGFYKLDGTYLVTSTARPTQYNFNASVPVGTFIGLSKNVVFNSLVAGSNKVGDIIGYYKNAAGTAASTWTTIYSKGA